MPELSRFYGIIIRMFMEAGAQHHILHFHAYYQDFTALFSIDQIDLIAGQFPKKQQRLVEAWAELHKNELKDDWENLQNGKLPKPIEPLK